MAYQTSELPPPIRQQVEDFIEFLLQRQQASQPLKENPRMKLYGVYQGKLRVSEDFDSPLDDFKPYM